MCQFSIYKGGPGLTFPLGRQEQGPDDCVLMVGMIGVIIVY